MRMVVANERICVAKCEDEPKCGMGVGKCEDG